MFESEVEDELLALGEIFQNDFILLGNTGPWGSRQFTIVCNVSSSTTVHSYGSVKLLFTISKTYPKTACQVEIIDVNLINKDKKVVLEKNIHSFCKQNTGRICCYDLIQQVQDNLLHFGPVKEAQSFYDAMQEREIVEKQNLQNIINTPVSPSLNIEKKMTELPKLEHVSNAWIDNDWLASILREDGSVLEDEDNRSSGVDAQSRYAQEFTEMVLLGKGASGEVCKCKNRLDGRLYAIKKILLEPGNTDASIYREVRCISGLLHKHVVRYYSAWIEFETQEDKDTKTSSENRGTIVSSDSFGSADYWNPSPNRIPLDAFADHDFLDSGSENDEVDNVFESRIFTSQPTNQNSVSNITIEVQRRLFIQMEYCKATLRSLIDKGQLHAKPSEVYHLLRQILEALAYIHEQGVIHRDLKPANIFLDQEGNIRLGDFGLATFSSALEAEPSSIFLESAGEEYSLTVGVGTALYRAPEYESKAVASRDYGDRADMYSLGIVLYEMVHKPFETGMERVKQIMQLRENCEILDVENGFENLKKVIKLLINKDPASRPSAADLLQSTMIPPRIGIDKAYLKQILQTIMSNANQEVSSEIIAALFRRRENHEYYLASYDYSRRTRQSRSLNVSPYLSEASSKRPERFVPQLLIKKRVEDILVYVFELFGAVRNSSLLLGQCDVDKTELQSQASVTLLDPGGKLVCLPTNLIAPFATYCGRFGIFSSSSYNCDRVYASNPEGGYPYEFTEAVYTAVSTDLRAGAVLQAECLSVAMRVLHSMKVDMRTTNFVIRVRDNRLLESILDLCAVKTPAMRRSVVDLFDRNNVNKAAKELMNLGLSEKINKDLLEFINVAASQSSNGVLAFLISLEKVFHSHIIVHKLKKQVADFKDIEKYRSIVTSFNDSVVGIRDTMSILLNSAVDQKSPSSKEMIIEGVHFEMDLGREQSSFKIHVDSSRDLHESYRCFSSHFCFLIEMRSHDKQLLLAEGGHFESFIYSHRPPSMPGKQLIATGLRFSIEKLLRVAARSSTLCSDIRGPIDVLVVFHNTGKGLDAFTALILATVLSDLRSAGLRATHPMALNMFKFPKVGASSELDSMCNQLNIPYVVTLNIGLKDSQSVEATIKCNIPGVDNIQAPSVGDIGRKIFESYKSWNIKKDVYVKEIFDSRNTSILIIFVDRNFSNRDKTFTKQADLIQDKLKKKLSMFSCGIVLVSDSASIHDLRELGSVILKHLHNKSSSVESSLQLLDKGKDAKVMKSLRCIFNEIIQRVSMTGTEPDSWFCLYSNESDQFDMINLNIAVNTSSASAKGVLKIKPR